MSDGEQRLTAELVADHVSPRAAVISPDGRWVAYLTEPSGVRGQRVSTLWVARTDVSSPPVALTDGSTWTRRASWAPDSQSVYFLSDQQVRRTSPDDGAAVTLLRWRADITGVLPLADGRRVALVAVDEPTQDDELRRAAGDDALVWSEPRQVSKLWLLDRASGSVAAVESLGSRHVTQVRQRPDGGPLAVISWDRPEDEPGAFTARLHLVDLSTGLADDLGAASLDARSITWWLARDGWHLSYLAVTPPGPVGGTAIFDIATASDLHPHLNLTSRLGACPAELAQVASGPPFALFAEGLDTTLRRLDPAIERFTSVITWTGRVTSLTASDSGSAIAVLATTAYRPTEVLAGSPDGGLSRLTDTGAPLRGITWGTQERLSYQARDGLALDGLLILPSGKSRADGPFPLITLVHGGPYDRYADKFQLAWWPSGQWLAAAGYAVFLPNPRGSAGRGHEFAAIVAGAVGTDEFTDILSGIDLLVADGVADPARLGIAGWSHGGFMTAWAVGQTGRFAAALMGAGIADWGLQAGTGELGDQETGLGGSAGWEGPGPHRHDELSPLSYASKVATPVLIVHGEKDTNVPVGQAVYFRRALAKFGVPHELVIYPRENHSITERRHQIDLLRRTSAWFDRWLLGDR